MKKQSMYLKPASYFPYLSIILAALLCAVFSGCTAAPAVQPDPAPDSGSTEIVYQVSTLNALMQGVYDGEIPIGQLTQEGDLGIGTFDGLDGEMVVLDGLVYQVRADGKAVEVEDEVKTPFAVVTFFDPEQQVQLTGIEDYAGLQAELDKLLPSPNMFYAFRIDGSFDYVKTRSVPKQNKPYPPLVEVTNLQPTFEFQDVQGTLVGFWCPSFVEGINMPGYHLHFLTEDRTAGGHLLGCALTEGSVSVDIKTEFQMLLPQNEHFALIDLDESLEEEIKQAEQ